LAFTLSPFRSKLPTFTRLPSASTKFPDPSVCWREVPQVPGAAHGLCVLAVCLRAIRSRIEKRSIMNELNGSARSRNP
jgi:hypothetical protein